MTLIFEIKSIKIVRKSKALLGATCGFLAGVLLTALAVYAANEGGDAVAAELGAIVYGGIVGVAGGLVGFVAGSSAETDETIQFE